MSFILGGILESKALTALWCFILGIALVGTPLLGYEIKMMGGL